MICMKKYFNLFLLLLLSGVSANAQYKITSTTWVPVVDTFTYCQTAQLDVRTNAYVSGLSVKTYYGGGKFTTTSVKNGTGFGYANCSTDFSSPGVYTVKQVLLNGTT